MFEPKAYILQALLVADLNFPIFQSLPIISMICVINHTRSVLKSVSVKIIPNNTFVYTLLRSNVKSIVTQDSRTFIATIESGFLNYSIEMILFI